MTLRWLWFDHFPPELGLTREQKQLARARASLHSKREPTYRGAQRHYLMLFVPIFFFGFVVWKFWGRQLIHEKLLPGVPPIMLSGAFWICMYAGLALILRRTRRPFIRRAIRDIGYELCEECGYWLRGLNADVKHCPECGAKREPMKREPVW